MKLLDSINCPEDLKNMDQGQLNELCQEIREFLVENVSKTGGHLASNLGVTELTVAIHKVFNTDTDRVIFDVGHQSYVHKLLTGRRDKFETLRQYGGIAGFPKPDESVHDAFIAGHASNSISVAIGMARARTIKKEKYSVVAVIGDGALTGGLAFEALNDAGQSGEPLIVILNDNGMSIAKNVGGISKHLAHERVKPLYYSIKRLYRKIMTKIPGGKYIYRFTHNVKKAIKATLLHCSMFEDMGFQYLGPVDGHDISKLCYFMNFAKGLHQPVIIHVTTKKGKGYKYSEDNPDEYHGVGPFDPENGIVKSDKPCFSSEFGAALTEMADENKTICAITAAMPTGTGLAEFSEKYPERFFDVGIAEGHAVTMAGGMAKQGLLPVFAVYSTFLQRSYDMLIHDIAIQKLHAVFAVDRAGLVGEDGETHHGVFDVAYLTSVPDMAVLCPSSYSELKSMLKIACEKIQGPVAVRYPRGSEGKFKGCESVASSHILKQGKDITIISYGININDALDAADILEKSDIKAQVIKLDMINPIDFGKISASVSETGKVVFIEECVAQGCVGERTAAYLEEHGIPAQIMLKNLGRGFIPHGKIDTLKKRCGIDAESVAESVITEFFAEC